MTDEQRAEIKRLAEAATPGPWRWVNPETDAPRAAGEYRSSLRTAWETPARFGAYTLPEFILDAEEIRDGEHMEANAGFIAAANPAAVLDLLKEHEEDQGVIRVWRGRCERAEAQRDALVTEVKRLMAVIAKADRDLECGATRGQVEADLCEALGEGA